MSRTFLAGIALAVLTQSAIDVGEERLVSVGGLDAPIVEPHLSIDPRDPNNLIAGAMVAQPERSYIVIGLSQWDGRIGISGRAHRGTPSVPIEQRWTQLVRQAGRRCARSRPSDSSR
jgi:hypothetical protein